MVIIIPVDAKSLFATLFLVISGYVLYSRGISSLSTVLSEFAFIVAVLACLYGLYKLILIINRSFG